VAGGGEAAELLAVEVGVAALVAGALDVGAEDVGAVEEAGEDAAVDEGELTAVAGVTTPPSTLDGTMSLASLAADM